MIYLIAPHSLKLNTTSHNRIFSFYTAIKNNGEEVKVFYPSPDLNTYWFSGQKETLNDTDNNDFFTVDTHLNLIQKLAFNSGLAKRYKAFWYLYYMLHYLIYQRDIYFTNNALWKCLRKFKVSSSDTLIVSSPPFGLFYEAYIIKKITKCHLILDYRDPWTYGYYPVGRKPLFSWLSKLLERNRENKILENATYITCVHNSIKSFFPEKYQNKTFIVHNGANSKFIDFNKIEAHPKHFRIVYLGTIHEEQLKEEVFFSAISKIIKNKNISPSLFEIAFIGSIKCTSLHEIIKKYQLQKFVRITDRRSIQKALEIGSSASALLHLRYGDRQQLITSKHTDYLALQKPILLPISDNGDIANSILEHHAGYVCNSPDECYNVLQELWEKYQRGESFKIPRSKEFLYSISREAEAEKLVKIIKSLQ